MDGPVRRDPAVTRPPAIAVIVPVTPVGPSAPAGPARRVRQRSAAHRGRRRLILAAVLTPLVLVVAAAGWILWPRGANHKLSAISIATSVIKSSLGATTTLKGQSTGRTNTVIYGMTKDGLRTDSIMLASYYWQQKKLVTLNIPRDLQVYDGYETCKFGEAYAYALNRSHGNNQVASQFIAGLVAKEYGIPVDYWVRFNMQGEVDLVNTLDGVDINVADSFTDYEYPTWNYSGYIRPAPSFKAGEQHMNGDTALIFSRSRHSLDNGEGTDFARSKRQSLVVGAVINKVKALGVVGNLTDISHYLTILGNNVDSSMSTDEMVSFAKMAKGIDPATDMVIGNWAVGDGFLCSSTSSVGAYITLYGTTGSCGTSAGGRDDSKYRELAIYYVNHLIDAAPMDAQTFVATATPNLPLYQTTTVTASAGGAGNVLSATATPKPTPIPSASPTPSPTATPTLIPTPEPTP